MDSSNNIGFHLAKIIKVGTKLVTWLDGYRDDTGASEHDIACLDVDVMFA
jgi:hypothetical protein